MKGLTERQREVLQLIAERIQETGYPPTIREIGEALGIRSTNGVNDHLKALERKGFLDRDTSKSRAMQLTARGEASVNVPNHSLPSAAPDILTVPLLGRIAAGQPIEAIESADEHVHIDPSLLSAGTEPVFALRVEGESMIGDGILDGDVIFVRQQSTARRGEIVAVYVDGSATVKRYYREGDRIRLAPSNPDMEDIIVHASEARETMILGKVIGVYRKM